MKGWGRIAIALVAGLAAAGAVVVTAPPRLDVATASELRPPEEALGVSIARRPTDLEGLEKHVAGLRRNDLIAWRWLGEAYRARDRDDDAKKAWRKCATLCESLLPDPQFADSPSPWFSLGWSRWRLGEQASAEPALRRAEELLVEWAKSRRNPAQAWSLIGYSRAALGDSAGAAEAWKQSLEFFQNAVGENPTGGVQLYDLACYRALVGETESAFTTLEQAGAAGWRDWGTMEWDPDLEQLRGDARFRAILEGLRREQSAEAR